MQQTQLYPYTFLIAIFLMGIVTNAQNTTSITLPSPDTTGGIPLQQALKARQSSRNFAAETLSIQTVSNLLWSAAGKNRPDGRRTAPTAMNCQEIDIYVFTATGVYIYKPDTHALEQLDSQDLRHLTGMQEFVAGAPLNLVYIANYEKMKKAKKDEMRTYAWADAGFVGQNVYLYCASEGLATVIRGYLDRPKLAAALQLKPSQEIILAQTLGYQKGNETHKR